jgi:hypothetical protein
MATQSPANSPATQPLFRDFAAMADQSAVLTPARQTMPQATSIRAGFLTHATCVEKNGDSALLLLDAMVSPLPADPQKLPANPS